jgi:mono/diheme cytochrome c family protein
MKVLIAIVLILIAGVLSAFGAMFSGIYNVAATEPRSAFAEWVLNTTMKQSVERHAQDIEVPDLGSTEQLYAGINNYNKMCAGCHAPPGESLSAVAKGLNPKPSDLAKSAERLSAQELFWVVKNGVKMTGMPAWGPTHSDDELWPIVAFAQQLHE